jgi:hypothetical protein
MHRRPALGATVSIDRVKYTVALAGGREVWRLGIERLQVTVSRFRIEDVSCLTTGYHGRNVRWVRRYGMGWEQLLSALHLCRLRRDQLDG